MLVPYSRNLGRVSALHGKAGDASGTSRTPRSVHPLLQNAENVLAMAAIEILLEMAHFFRV